MWDSTFDLSHGSVAYSVSGDLKDENNDTGEVVNIVFKNLKDGNHYLYHLIPFKPKFCCFKTSSDKRNYMFFKK